MIKGIMGEANLKTAIFNYVQAFAASGNVKHEQLLDHLDTVHVNATSAPEGELKTNIAGWITQKGYPVVKVTQDYSSVDPGASKDLSYTQRRFLLSGTETGTPTSWSIPFTLTHGGALSGTSNPSASLEATKKPLCWLTGGATAAGTYYSYGKRFSLLSVKCVTEILDFYKLKDSFPSQIVSGVS